MLFPETSRIEYSNNPLEQVICQIRFPAILRISQEVPVKYQEAIQQEYPVYNLQRIGQVVPPRIAQLLPSVSYPAVTNAHQFVSADEKWILTLSLDSLALTSRAYQDWNHYKAHLQEPLSILVSHYKPAFFSRIGLRYQDVIRRSRLQIDNVPWSELLQPHITGILSSSDIAKSIEQVQNQAILKLDGENSHVRILHGLAVDTNNEEECFLIDSDFYTDNRTDTDNAIKTLDSFNLNAANFFRWCIREPLHRAMGPKPAP